MDVRVRFFGGAETVTGSKYLLEIDDKKILVDCGLFQGLKELRLKNWDDIPFNPAEVDLVVLTHAHLDHSGYLPKLVKSGYEGDIYCTEPSVDLLELLLKDSAKLQEEEAEFARKKGYSKHDNPQPLYNTADVKKVLPLLRGFGFGKTVNVSERISIVFHNAGHILGASIVEFIVRGEYQTKRIVFSGDLGPKEDPILYPPEKIKEADILFIESTYGNRVVERRKSNEDIHKIINETMDKNGVVLIPAFSVGRTQNILIELNQMFVNKEIPEVPIFMDSPMAIRATELYRKFDKYHKINKKNYTVDKYFGGLIRNLNIVQSQEASEELNNFHGKGIIISASGMMTGGRILHHLYNRLRNTEDTLLIVGFQAEGTRGRKIIDGDKFVRIFGQEVPVMCRVENVKGLSAHGDQSELLDWTSGFESSPKMTFVVHGEKESSQTFAQVLNAKYGWNTFVPKYGQSFELFKGI
ncbi:MBL fold metallo-hydrolase [Aureibacter tunicatorum]|uniref:Metallo-beta-lactamase family protein n=1 Tax=Aureibacter tunicatorum TaxID=866807 RepID=A0AAE4BSU2_9BACT|nr:MBL fold metallo-hydrolase [Aureibacter tunicatorum]MDR6241554.1 metallo-beta-lactamase family protein [Aureibacter tunicatorum]BDD07222.1 MBL fold hydrolase [Aureibacter tunicatorum]